MTHGLYACLIVLLLPSVITCVRFSKSIGVESQNALASSSVPVALATETSCGGYGWVIPSGNHNPNWGCPSGVEICGHFGSYTVFSVSQTLHGSGSATIDFQNTWGTDGFRGVV
eukprot:4979662-Pyramimonas_sp.AAC.1